MKDAYQKPDLLKKLRDAVFPKPFFRKQCVLEEDGIGWHVYDCGPARMFNDRSHFCVFDRQEKPIDEEILWSDPFEKKGGMEINSYIRQSKHAKTKKLKGTVAGLYSHGSASNYYHWLFDVLPRIGLLKLYQPDVDPDIYLFAGDMELPHKKQSLDLLGIPEHKRLGNTRHHHVLCQRLLVTDHPTQKQTRPDARLFHWSCHFLRETFLPAAARTALPERFYIQRGDSSTGRQVANEPEVIDFLRQHDIQPLLLSSLSFKEQIGLFASAKLVIGVHGAGFANSVFCSPGTKILEMHPANYHRNYFSNIAGILGLDHSFLPLQICGSDARPVETDVLVNIPDLKKMITIPAAF